MRSSNPNANATPWRSHTVRVQHVVQETPGVATYALVFTRTELVNAYRFLPGQFNMLYIPGVVESAISISSDPKLPHIMRHTIRSVGGVTHAIAEAGIGTTLGLRGPFGSSWPIEFFFKRLTIKKYANSLSPFAPRTWRASEVDIPINGRRNAKKLLRNSRFVRGANGDIGIEILRLASERWHAVPTDLFFRGGNWNHSINRLWKLGNAKYIAAVFVAANAGCHGLHVNERRSIEIPLIRKFCKLHRLAPQFRSVMTINRIWMQFPLSRIANSLHVLGPSFYFREVF